MLATFSSFSFSFSMFSISIFFTSSLLLALMTARCYLVFACAISVFCFSSVIRKLERSLSIFSKRYLSLSGIRGLVTRMEMMLIPGAQL